MSARPCPCGEGTLWPATMGGQDVLACSASCGEVQEDIPFTGTGDPEEDGPALRCSAAGCDATFESLGDAIDHEHTQHGGTKTVWLADEGA